MLLKHTFEELISKYIDNPLLAEEFWSELQSSYFNSERHYHTLSHLEQMLSELLTVQAKIEDWGTLSSLLFSITIVFTKQLVSKTKRKVLNSQKKGSCVLAIP